MVSFICDACGNTVKKTQVEKHYTTVCRNCSVLSCLDCGVDFPGDAYISHTSCVTEAEKYQGHLYQAKDKENKGETKQKEWLRSVQGTSSQTADPKLRNLLKKLTAYSNIPRKKKKFDNFCKNSVNVYDAKTLDQLWDLFTGGNDAGKQTSQSENSTESAQNGQQEVVPEETVSDSETKPAPVNGPTTVDETSDSTEETVTKKKKKKKKADKSVECNVASDTITDNNAAEPKKKKKKKHQVAETVEQGNCVENGERKLGKKTKLIDSTEPECNPNKKLKTEDEDNTGEEGVSAGKFLWHRTIKQILREQEDGELSLKKLRKKVLSAYQAHGLDHRASTESEAMALCEKKIKSYPKAKIIKDKVKLVK